MASTIPKKKNKISISFVEDGKEVSQPYSFFTGEEDDVDIGKYGVYYFMKLKNGFPMNVYSKTTLKVMIGDKSIMDNTPIMDVPKQKSCTFDYVNRLNRKNKTNHIPLLVFTLP
jgi:hypothetical protein